MVVEAAFWFHPLVWWIGNRLVEERERACDEEVLRGSDPQTYAEGILKVCEHYLECPLSCVAGVSGSNLRRRIEGIMNDRILLNLNGRKRLLLTLAGIFGVTAPIVIGMVNAPFIHAQSRPADTPKWEVASIRTCGDFGQGERGASVRVSPGRITINCQVVMGLITSAYLRFASGADAHDPSLMLAAPIEGGPSWLNSRRYTVNAKAEGDATPGMMQGPMLQALLEDRFKLKIHRETRGAVPVYALIVAKGGSKLKPFAEGSCVPLVLTNPPTPPPPLAPGEKYCTRQNSFSGGDMVIDAQGISIDEFRKIYLSGSPLAGLDRRVIDETELVGRFDIHLKYAPPPDFAALRERDGKQDPEPTAPSIFTAVQEQLGLKLEPKKEPQEVLVIDQIEQPSEN
jgi:uncharacterized protein (TIGR03435 family)